MRARVFDDFDGRRCNVQVKRMIDVPTLTIFSQ